MNLTQNKISHTLLVTCRIDEKTKPRNCEKQWKEIISIQKEVTSLLLKEFRMPHGEAHKHECC